MSKERATGLKINKVFLERNEYTGMLAKKHGVVNGSIVEVGVLRGAFSKVLLSINPASLTLVDPYRRFSTEEFPDYTDYSQSKWDELHAKVKNTFEADSRVSILRNVSENAVREFKNNSLDMVYLDGNHTYPFIYKDLRLWYAKVKKGGILAGHDYPLPSVKKAVQEFCKEKGIKSIQITKSASVASYYIVK